MIRYLCHGTPAPGKEWVPRCGMEVDGQYPRCQYPAYTIPPPWNGSLDARDDLRVCSIHYDLLVRAAWDFLGIPWNEHVHLTNYTEAGIKFHVNAWARRPWRSP